MGCNCGKNRVTAFVVTDTNGNCVVTDPAGNCVVYPSAGGANMGARVAGLTPGTWQVRPR